MRTGCLCSSAASLPVAPIRPAHPSHSHTQILRRRARCIRTLQLASEVSYSQLKVCAPVSPVSKSPAPGRVTPTGSCFPFQFRGQRLRVDPLTLHPPPLQARPCPSRHFPQPHPSPAQPCPALPRPAQPGRDSRGKTTDPERHEKSSLKVSGGSLVKDIDSPLEIPRVKSSAK